MPLVVSDSSTLIHLARIGQFLLLHRFFDRVVIPPAVWREVVDMGQDRPGVADVASARQENWLDVQSSTNDPLLRLLQRDLDAGEAEAIALAVERKADLILLDEALGRQAAALYGLKRTGVVGILMRARREGLVTSLKTELDRLRTQSGFRISDQLYYDALHAVGELP
jgi:uncharacterized protein